MAQCFHLAMISQADGVPWALGQILPPRPLQTPEPPGERAASAEGRACWAVGPEPGLEASQELPAYPGYLCGWRTDRNTKFSDISFAFHCESVEPASTPADV